MLQLLMAVLMLAGATSAGERVQLTLDASEAEAVLAILDARAAGQPVTQALWAALTSSEPYVRLRRREEGMRRPFSDEDFRAFVGSDELLQRAPELRKALDAWKATDLRAV